MEIFLLMLTCALGVNANLCSPENNCIKKCCESGSAFFDSECKRHNGPLLLPARDGKIHESDIFRIVYNSSCDGLPMYKLEPSEYEEDFFYVQEDGKLFLPNREEDSKLIEPHLYCVENFVEDDSNHSLSALVCVEEEEQISPHLAIGMLISIPFLLATFLVYVLLPEKRNLHGKCMMNYVFTLTVAYVVLVYIQIFPIDNDEFCVGVGAACLFFFLVSFFWVNVICVDIWKTFRGMGRMSTRRKTKKRFVIYSLYAWTLPTMIVVVVLSINGGTSKYHPGIGKGQCWLADGLPTFLYFYGPLAVLLSANVIMFATTAYKIKRAGEETSMLRNEESKRHNSAERQSFQLYVKLLLAMGINWSLEVISWAVDRKYPGVKWIWYVPDTCNACYGIFIFFLFAFKKSIWVALKKRIRRDKTSYNSAADKTTSFNLSTLNTESKM